MNVGRLGHLALITLSIGCSDEARVIPIYEGYDGGAPYPNRRPKIELPAGDFALVPSAGADTLTVLELGTNRTLGSAPVGRNPVVLDGPNQVIADRARRFAYVVHAYPPVAGTHSHGASTRPGWVQAFRFDDLSAVGEVRIDPNPGEIALSEDGRRLVVTHFDLDTTPYAPIEARRSTIAVLDPTTMLPFGTPDPEKIPVCVSPHGVALSRPDGRKIFVACHREDAIAIVDLQATSIVRVPVGEGARQTGAPAFAPYGVALSPDGTRLAIGAWTTKDVRFLDVTTGTMSPVVVALLGEPYSPAWSADGTRVYVPTRVLDALVAIDVVSGTIVTQRSFDRAVCGAPMEAIVSPDGEIVHVVCEGSSATPGAIVSLDANTLEVRGRVEVGPFPGRPFIGRGP